MACRCEISDKELEADLIASLLSYVYTQQDQEITLSDNYKNLENNTINLCKLCKRLEDSSDSYIIYDGRVPMARKLADWWDKHKKIDYEREKRDREILYTQLVCGLTTSVFYNADVKHILNDQLVVKVICEQCPTTASDDMKKWLTSLRDNNIDPTNIKLELEFG